jgi:tRNA dimethylallyltransferase
MTNTNHQDYLSENKKTLIVLLGPTGVGKTNISLKIAEEFQAPIISSDSRQLYRELKIGTAAPSEAELNLVKHYFIGTHSIHDEYNAGQYELDVIKLLNDIYCDSHAALLVGGSMMYIDAVCNGMDDLPAISPEVRNYWINEYRDKGLGYLLSELQRLDPEHYQQVDIHNHKRVIHALEICMMTGQKYSELRTGNKKSRDFRICKIGLNRPRQELYDRINIRVDEMIASGLVQEAEMYYQYKDLNTLNTVGYKELYAWMDGKLSFDEAVNLIKQDSRRYAKRQLTWFRRDEEVAWFHPDNQSDILKHIHQFIQNQ